MSKTGSIDCRSFEDRIHQILDDRLTLSGDDLLMTHASDCADCEKILNDYDSVDDSIKLLPADLAEILQAADARQTATPLISRRLAVLTSLAAMIVVSLNVFQFLEQSPPRSSHVAKVAPAPSFAVVSAHITEKISPVEIQAAVEPRATLDTSPFSPNFSMVSTIPTLPSVPTVPSWVDISKSLDSLEPVLNYSTKIPAVRPVHCSLNATINLLKQSFSKTERNPDLGFWIDPDMLAAV